MDEDVDPQALSSVSGEHKDRIGELAEEFVGRIRIGERPDWQDYAKRYPDLAVEIRDLFPAMMLMERSRGWQLEMEEIVNGASLRNPKGEKLERLGDFRLLREVGRGGMGIVYEAIQESLERRVALKILSPSLMLNPVHLQRFRNEAKSVAQLHHTHIVPLYGVGEMLGIHYFVMPLIDGWGLDEVLVELQRVGESDSGGNDSFCTLMITSYQSERIRYFHRVCQIGAQVAEALAYSHSEGILHRDIKPSNILIDTHGNAWLTDFGMAKSKESEELTQSNDMIGTLRYMPPERLRGHSGVCGDIYSLGLVLYELATLSPAFATSERTSLLEQISKHEPLQPTKIDESIPKDLETILLKCIQKEPDARYATADDLLEDLKLFLADLPIRARRIHWLTKTWRWCRRNPTMAGLEVALAVTFLVGFGTVTWKWRDAELARRNESESRMRADAVASQWKQSLEDLREANNLIDMARKSVQEMRWDDAALAYYRATQKCPDNAAMWNEQSDVAAHWGLYDIARKGFTEVFRCKEPETSEVWFRLALLHMHFGDEVRYRAIVEQMSAKFAGTTNQGFTRDLVRSQLLDSRQNTASEAITHRMAAVDGWEPGTWFNQYLCGISFLRDGQNAQAVLWLQRALNGTPENDGRKIIYPALAMAQFKNGDEIGAKSSLQLARDTLDEWIEVRCKSQPGWLIHWNFFGEMPIPWYDWLEFNLYCREASLLIDGNPPPDDPRINLLKARTYAGMRLYDLAEKHFSEVLVATPDDPKAKLESLRLAGQRAANRRDFIAAAASFERASQLDQDDVMLWRQRAMSHLALRNLDAVGHDCEEMLSRFGNTQDAGVATVLLYVCVTQSKAIADRGRLIPAAEVASRGWHNSQRCYGAVLFRNGHFQEAANFLEKVEVVFQTTAWDMCFLAMAYHHLGNPTKAQLYLQRAQDYANQADGVDESNPSGNHTGDEIRWSTWDDRVAAMEVLSEASKLILGVDIN